MILQEALDVPTPSVGVLSWTLWTVIVGLTIWSGLYVVTAGIGGITLAYVLYNAFDEDFDDHPAGGPSPLEMFSVLVGIAWMEFIYALIASIVLIIVGA